MESTRRQNNERPVNLEATALEFPCPNPHQMHRSRDPSLIHLSCNAPCRSRISCPQGSPRSSAQSRPLSSASWLVWHASCASWLVWNEDASCFESCWKDFLQRQKDVESQACCKFGRHRNREICDQQTESVHSDQWENTHAQCFSHSISLSDALLVLHSCLAWVYIWGS